MTDLASTAASDLTTPPRVTRVPWRCLVIAILPLAAVYLAMLNPYWVPSGDGEVYTCIARSLVKGEGLMFNGSRAAIAPPGWPLVLSLAMRVSAEFWFLKLVIIACMLGAMASAFFVVRRYARTDASAAGVVLLTATLSSVYPLTYWTHTESFFCLLGFTAILIAFRISEGRARLAWELTLMLALLAFGAFTRWPGLLHFVLVVPVLLSGRDRSWKRRSLWTMVALVFVACYGTFQVTHSYMSLTKDEQAQANQMGATADAEGPESDVGNTAAPMTGAPVPRVGDDKIVPGLGDISIQSKRGPLGEAAYRVGTSGRWFAWLLWQPTRFGQSIRAIDVSALVFGWLAIALLAVTMVRDAKRRDYFWVGLAVYTGGLCVLWPNPNARYFVPVAPFILVGILRGIREVSAMLRERWGPTTAMPMSPLSPQSSPPALAYKTPSTAAAATRLPDLDSTRLHPACAALAVVFVVVTLLANLPLLAIDVYVFRSHDFYAKYEAGANKELLEVAAYIKANPHAGAIAVHERYDNLGRVRYSKYGIRALHLLCDQQVIPVERKAKLLRLKPNDDDLRKWLRRNEAGYCVTQESWTPWRVWHFRLGPAFQEKLTGRAVPYVTGGWDLWSRTSARYVLVTDVPQTFAPPRRVPGL